MPNNFKRASLKKRYVFLVNGRQDTRDLKSGQAVLIATIFFMLISVVVISGIAIPVSKQVKISNDLQKSRNSFFLAEAGLEDVLYRLVNGYTVLPSEEFNFDGETAEIVVTDTPNGKTIVVESDYESYFRKIEMELVIGEGHAFNYGIQTGKGGFEIRNATVVGNIFGNGDLIGTHSGASVEGSAVAANKPADYPDQANSSPEIPSKSIIFGDQDQNQDVAQSFMLTNEGILSKIEIKIKKMGFPNSLTARIVENDPGHNRPSDVTIAQSVIRSYLVTGQYGWIEFYFPSDTFLEADTTYWLVLDGLTNSDAYYYWASNDASYQYGEPQVGKFGGSWSTSSNKDGYFKIFLEGSKSRIEQLNVGSSDEDEEEAYAYEVKNSNVYGDIFCQIGTNNNIACNNSREDPDPQAFPISEANIVEWKAQAEDGGVIEGDYVAEDLEQLGPVKIDGDLTLAANDTTLTLLGTLWVTGNITVPNGSLIRLSPSYGSNSGIVLADGFVSLANGVLFNGSSQDNSYIMLLTTSECPDDDYCGGQDAIEVNNNVGAVILNAQKGTIHFNNNSGAKEATARRLIMDNNSFVRYESGLTNVNFVSGPSGGFVVKSWKEVE